MHKTSRTAIRLLLLLILASPALAQRERQVAADSTERKFFEQLRNLFGRFRDGDLQRAFAAASPIHCSDLISDNGEWRPVAFFNEDRKLGDWYHGSLEEVKSDLSAYIFKGPCSTEQSTVQLVTKFPVQESIDRYVDGRIRFDQIKINVNAPVRAAFDSRTQSYRFDLPYLYAVRGKTRETVYSLFADRADARYVTNVTNQWECKFVRANDVTFQFLICDTWTVPHDLDPKSRSTQSFGAAAYFILSDGKEAQTSVKLSFGNEKEAPAPAPPDREDAEERADREDRDDRPVGRSRAPAPDAPAGPLAAWKVPGSASRLADVEKGEFRIRFSPQTWASKIGSAQVLSDQKMSIFDAARPPAKVDYCVWRPASATLAPRVLGNEPDADVSYTLTMADTSISFDMKTHNGSRLGTLQCFFPGAAPVEGVSVDRWVSVVGGHLTIEVLP